MKFRKIVTLITVGAMLAGTGVIGAMAAEKTTKEQAQEIALEDAGLTEDEVTFEEVEKGSKRGASVYEIEFYTDSKEYEYEIALADGEIVSAGWELTESAAEGKKVTEAQAKGVAMRDAGVKDAKTTFSKSKSGTENGIPVYEFEFEDDSKEFKYDITKEGGVILNRSMTVKTPACTVPADKAAAAK